MNYAVDTNLLVSATFSQTTPPALVIAAWRMEKFSWITCSFQLDEIADTLVKPNLVARSRGGLPMMRMLIAKIRENCRLASITRPLPAFAATLTMTFCSPFSTKAMLMPSSLATKTYWP